MCLCYDSGNKVAVIVIMVIIKFMNTSLLVLILVAFFLANYQSRIEISILEGCTCVGKSQPTVMLGYIDRTTFTLKTQFFSRQPPILLISALKLEILVV